jgi:hypothetical protein
MLRSPKRFSRKEENKSIFSRRQNHTDGNKPLSNRGLVRQHIERVELASARNRQKHFEEKFTSHQSGWLIQQFMPEIAEGEWSFIFFRGEFSHALLKRPANGNIYVQKKLGGINTVSLPPAHYQSQAETILQNAAAFLRKSTSDFSYARVDAIPRHEKLFLMELELMEPGLSLDQAGPGASERFADCITSIVASAIEI